MLRPLTAFALVSLSSLAFAGTRYVDASLASGLNDGSSWANAHRGVDALATALGAATAGDQVWVADGTYLPTATGLRTVALQLKNGVEVYGGFAGGEASLGQRDFVANVAILSGDLAGNDASSIFTDNSIHVLNGAGTNATAVLDGFVVRGGNANVSGGNQDRGGGILCVSGASPTIRNARFLANRCSFGGGAGYINASSPTFTDCTFEGNFGASFGGAFDMATNVAATFERCTFRGNSAARAGAIEIFSGSSVKVYNSLFVQNASTGTGGGGAIYISGSSPQIRNCTITGNTASLNAAGGILGSSASPTIVNCIVDANVGQGGSTGTAAQISPSNLNVTYSLIVGYAGTGNISAPPSFDNCAPAPFRLTPFAPGVDAGNNAGLPVGSTLDLLGLPRRLDNASVPDTGLGSPPLIDMGAYEASPDCNGNGISDGCDIAGGSSNDLNGNGIPDECECQGGAAPTIYCTAKFNSQFCLPAIGFSGFASVSSAAPFLITATEILNNKAGLLLYGYQAASTPFQGGTLCVAAPIKRTVGQNSFGNPPGGGLDCSGSFSFDFNAFLQSGVNPQLLVIGQQVNAQYWSRDPQDFFGTNTTDAVQFAVCQ